MSDLISLTLETYLDIIYWIKYRKQRKNERENNLPKSIVWYPYLKQFIVIIFILFLISFSVLIYTSIGKNEEKTKKRMLEISKLLEAEKKQFGKYPSELKEIIRNNPLRKNIETDFWKSTFTYFTSENGKNYQLISLGSDKKLNTKDDILLSSN